MIRKKWMAVCLLMLLLVPAVFAQDDPDPKKKDAERLVLIKPLKTFYDSVLTKTGVFYAITIGEEELVNVSVGMYSFMAVSVNDSDLVRQCNASGLTHNALLETITQMKKAACFEIGNSGQGTDRFEIQISYKLRIGGKRLVYMFPIGKEARVRAKTNPQYELVMEEIYKEKYKQR